MKKRSGAILPLAAILLVFIVMLHAFVIDHAYMGLIKAEAQRCADSGALAGAGALSIDHGNRNTLYSIGVQDPGAGHDTARVFVQMQENVRPEGYTTEPNTWNYDTGDVVLGRIIEGQFVIHEQPNAVKVTLRLTDSNVNGSTRLFYPELNPNFVTTLTATARIDYPTLLPFAIYMHRWGELLIGGDGDFNNDGIPDISVFPGTWDGNGMPPGNFGAIQIGPVGSATTLMEQIDKGPTPSDMEQHGGALRANDIITGSTGMNATVEQAINGGPLYEGMIGKPRYLALYSHAEGNGTNAEFTIHSFRSVRIVYANLRGNNKRIVVQAVPVGTSLNNLYLVE